VIVKRKHYHIYTFFLILSVILSVTVVVTASAESGFKRWIANFYTTAAEEGISPATYTAAFAGVDEPDELVLEKAAYQPEFTTKIWDYIDARVNALSIGKGKEKGEQYSAILADVEKRFRVRSSILLAIWSMESNFGAILNRPGKLHYVPRALATLGYGDVRRGKFARTQLVASLKILESGDVERFQLLGSWAGAMGHTQFIPTSYLAYGVDMDGDGRCDIWNSVADALATAANLLHSNGWRPGKTWGYEVILPVGGERYKDQTRTLEQWSAMGFKRPAGRGFLHLGDKGVLKIFAGSRGPAFIMLKNFFVLKRYNNADSYALAVGLLSDQLVSVGGLVQPWPRPPGSLAVKEKIELQRYLQQYGFYKGEIDGYIGSGTRKAIRDLQLAAGLGVDGVPTRGLLKLLHNKKMMEKILFTGSNYESVKTGRHE